MKGVLSTGFAELSDSRLYYEATGAGPAVVLLHCASTDHRIWDDQFEKFAKNYFVIRYDARGVGESEMPAHPFSYTTDLAGLLDDLEVEAARLVGIGEGAAVALDYARRTPQRVAALVLASPILTGLQWLDEHQASLDRLLGDEGGFEPGLITEGVLDSIPLAALGDREHAHAILEHIFADNAHLIEARHMSGAPLGALAVESLEDISAPTLVVIGESDSDERHAVCRALMAHIPNASGVTVLGAGQYVNLEQPEVFNRVVLEFLNSAG